MRKLFLALILSAAVGFTACGRADDPVVEDAGATTTEAEQDRNDADVEFAQNMIRHHQQAVEMSAMVLERGETAEVKALAQRITDAQTSEIDLMEGWLSKWGEDEEAGMDMDMPGEMSEEDMAKLEAASGRELDKVFLEMMVPHHESAIEMARIELEDGESSEAKTLAERVIEDQTAEIAEIKGLLAEFA